MAPIPVDHDRWDSLSLDELQAMRRDAAAASMEVAFDPGIATAGADAFVEARSASISTASRADRAQITLVAEGDSWFDYLPGTDLLVCLRHNFGYRIVRFARAGDTLENMVFGSQVAQVLGRVRELQPRVLLLSAGGNDVAGDEFDSYLNHVGSGLDLVRRPYLDFMLNTVFRRYYTSLIERVRAVSPETTIITHGYGHTLPTGKGVIHVPLLNFNFVGPWLLPGLAKKGVQDAERRRAAVVEIIDAFNDLLASIQAANPAAFRYVDLRPVLNPDTDWANELHLTNSAYSRASEHIHLAIEEVLAA